MYHNILIIFKHSIYYTTGTTSATPSPSLGGWLPREMILGSDASARAPNEFIPQIVNIANPPTYWLKYCRLNMRNWYRKDVLLASSPSTSCANENSSNNQNKSSSQESCQHTTGNNINNIDEIITFNQDIESIESFFHSTATPLNDWIYWFLLSQSGPHTVPGSFQWRGRVA